MWGSGRSDFARGDQATFALGCCRQILRATVRRRIKATLRAEIAVWAPHHVRGIGEKGAPGKSAGASERRGRWGRVRGIGAELTRSVAELLAGHEGDGAEHWRGRHGWRGGVSVGGELGSADVGVE